MAKADRVGKRITRLNRRERTPDLGYYFIATDTKETEEKYLYGLRDALPNDLRRRIVIKVLKTKTKDLVTVCQDKAAMEPQYGEPWIVFDRDQVTNFDEIIEKATQANINVGWSNPCIEIWFNAYFGTMPNYQDSVICCQEFAKTFKNKTKQEYEKSNSKIYNFLNRYGNEKKAIDIAERRFKQHLENEQKKPSEMCPCTTIHRLVDEINKKTGK